MKYYDILEVSEDASQSEIKAAYREKVKETHPDQSDHPNAAQLFMNVQEAYDILGDPQMRARYDDGALGESEAGHSGSTASREQSSQSQSTARDDSRGVGWRAHTRDTTAAEDLWEQHSPQSEKPPHPDSFAESRLKSKGSIGAMGLAGFILGILFADNLMGMIFPAEIAPLSVMQMGWAGVGILLAGVVVLIGIGEVLLGTHRRIYSIK